HAQSPTPYLYILHTPAHPDIHTLSLHDALPIYHDLSKIYRNCIKKLVHLFSQMNELRKIKDILVKINYTPDFDKQLFQLHPIPSDRKSTRLNSSHVKISYAVFCLKKKKNSSMHE